MATDGLPIARRIPGDDWFAAQAAYQVRHRYWLHALLLVLTLISTTIVGAGMARTFEAGKPVDVMGDLEGYVNMWHDPAFLLSGLPFSLTLLAILLVHEFGHYLTARYYGVAVTLPFFLPAPTLIGTLGAFIRIRSPILFKRVLFDIGIAGPLAGFALLIPPLAIGVSMSKVIHSVPAIANQGDVLFGTPLILQLFERVLLSGASPDDILLHPVARAAWVGLLATALNLLPIGQLDGGHILYAFVGEHTRWLSRIFIAMLVMLGGYQLFTSDYKVGYSWLFWAGLLFFFGMRHPSIVDPRPMGRGRAWLGLASLIMLVLCFTVAPIH